MNARRPSTTRISSACTWLALSVAAFAMVVISASLTPGHAATLTAQQIMSQFNAVISQGFTSSSDVEGRLVVNALNGGTTFYNQPSAAAAASAFSAVNAVTAKDGINANINNGGSVNLQTPNASAHFNFNGGGSLVNSPLFTISDFTAPLNALSSQLSGLTANSSVDTHDFNNYVFNATPDANGLSVFTIDAATLANGRNLNFSNETGTIVVNVTGTGYAETGNFNGDGFVNTHVIWNFADATSLSFSGWHGAILAPSATVTNTSAIEGFLYAESFNGNGEIHDRTFAGTLPQSPASPVPEPASVALLGMGLLGLVSLRRGGRRPA